VFLCGHGAYPENEIQHRYPTVSPETGTGIILSLIAQRKGQSGNHQMTEQIFIDFIETDAVIYFPENDFRTHDFDTGIAQCVCPAWASFI